MDWFYKVFHSCKEVSQMSCEGPPKRGLSRLKYKMHLAMCEACRVYAEKIKLLDQAVKKVVRKNEEHSQPSDSTIEKIIKDVIQSQTEKKKP